MKTRSRKKATRWELYYYYVSMIIGVTRGFLIIPFYIKFIDNQLYGAWLATGSVLGWIQAFNPGTAAILKQRVAQEFGGNNKENIGLYISSGLLITLIVIILILLGGFFISDYLDDLLKLNMEQASIQELKIAFLVALMGTAFSVFSFSLRAINKGFLYTRASNIIILSSSIVGLLIIVLLLFSGFGLISIAWGIFSNGLLTFIGNFFLTVYIIKTNQISLALRWGFIKKFSRLFSYTFFSKVGTVMVERSDLIIISRFLGQDAVTSFELTRRPIRIAFEIINKASVALMPAIANLVGMNDNIKIKTVFNRFFRYIIWGSTFVAIIFILFNESIIFLWLHDKNIFIGSNLNTLLVIAILLRSNFYNLSNFTFSLGNIKGNSLILIYKSTVYFLSLILLAKWMGLFGVILAAIFSILVSEVWYYPNRIKNILGLKTFNYYWQSYSIISFALVFMSILFKKIIIVDGWFFLILYCLLVFLIYSILLYVFSRTFRTELNGYIHRFIKN